MSAAPVFRGQPNPFALLGAAMKLEEAAVGVRDAADLMRHERADYALLAELETIAARLAEIGKRVDGEVVVPT